MATSRTESVSMSALGAILAAPFLLLGIVLIIANIIGNLQEHGLNFDQWAAPRPETSGTLGRFGDAPPPVRKAVTGGATVLQLDGYSVDPNGETLKVLYLVFRAHEVAEVIEKTRCDAECGPHEAEWESWPRPSGFSSGWATKRQSDGTLLFYTWGRGYTNIGSETRRIDAYGNTGYHSSSNKEIVIRGDQWQMSGTVNFYVTSGRQSIAGPVSLSKGKGTVVPVR